MPYLPPDSTSSAVSGVLQRNKDYLVSGGKYSTLCVLVLQCNKDYLVSRGKYSTLCVLVLQRNKDYLVLHCPGGNIAHCVYQNHTSVTVILYGFMQCICPHYKYTFLPTTKTDARQVGQW